MYMRAKRYNPTLSEHANMMIEILSCLWKPSFLLDVKMVCHVSLFPNLANLNVIIPMKPLFACRFQSGMSCFNQTKTHKASLFWQPTCHLANLHVIMHNTWFYIETILAFKYQNGGGSKKGSKNVKKKQKNYFHNCIKVDLMSLLGQFCSFFVCIFCWSKYSAIIKSCWHH